MGKTISDETTQWTLLLSAVVLAIYFYVFMEWLFFVTKPSFVAAMGRIARLGVLLITPLPIAGLLIVLIGMFWLAAEILKRGIPPAWVRGVGWALPAVILAACTFLLIDNFTYTLFHFGVGSTGARWRSAYVLLFLFLFAGLYRALGRMAHGSWGQRHHRVLLGVAVSLVLTSTAFGAWRYGSITPLPHGPEGKAAPREYLPNILIVSTDGLNAAHMSAYGRPRATTPYIQGLLERALVCENVLANASVTAGSTVSMLTGKLPTRTRVFHQGQILDGVHAYQHLPGILRRLGYRSISLVPGVANPFALNMRYFDLSNTRELQGILPAVPVPRRLALAFSPEIYFLEHLSERIGARVQHASGARRMVNPFHEATLGQGASDSEQVDAMLDFLAESPDPVFAHLHLMSTHGPWKPRRRVFSASSTRLRDLGDDVLLDFDDLVAKIVSGLSEQGKLGRTVIVITSDHGERYSHQRIPLLFLFPDGAYRGRIAATVQLLDVAPTLLDYLGVPIPEWMEGHSLIASKPDRARPIISVNVRRTKPGHGTMQSVAVTSCDHVFELEFWSDTLTPWLLEGHTARCRAEEVLDEQRARKLLEEHLRRSDYDLAVLKQAAEPGEGLRFIDLWPVTPPGGRSTER